jgi:Tfp pilus assembly protein PilO
MIEKLFKSKIKTALFVLGMGIVFGVYSLYDFVGGEQATLQSQVQQKEQQIGQLKGELERVRAFAQNIPAVKQAFREQSLQLESVLEFIPRNLEIAGVLRKLNMLAQNSGVEIISFRPEKSEQDMGFFKSTTIDLTLRGSFTQSLVFFDQVSKLKRVLNFETLKMTGNPEDKKTSTHVLETVVKMKAYRLSES